MFFVKIYHLLAPPELAADTFRARQVKSSVGQEEQLCLKTKTKFYNSKKMAEKHEVESMEKESKETSSPNPVISPLVKELNSDQLMLISDDMNVFSQFYETMINHSKQDDGRSPEAVAASFLHSTPLRPTLTHVPRSCPLLTLEPNESRAREVLQVKAYLVIATIFECFCLLF